MLIPFHFKYVFFISIRMEKTKGLSGIHPEDWYKNEQNADTRTGNGTETLYPTQPFAPAALQS